MKKLLAILSVTFLFVSLLTISSFASDYFVYDAYDLYSVIGPSAPYSLNEDIVVGNNTIYARVNVTADGTGGDGTQFNVNIASISKDFYIKDYPVVKFGYRSNAAATGAYIDLNVGVNYNGSASRLWGNALKYKYDKSGNDASAIIDISTAATGGEMGSGYTWANVDSTSPVNYLRFKTYWSGQRYVKGEYFDIEYIAFFKTVADAEAFDFDYDFSKGITEIYLKEQVRRVVKGNSINMNLCYVPAFMPAPTGVTYESDNTSVATVDANGKVTAVSAGTAVITAKYNGLSSTCKVFVLDKEIAPVEFISRDEAAPASNVITSSLGDSITTYAPNPNGGMNYHDWWGQWFYVTNEDRGISGTRVGTATGDDPTAFVNRYDQMRDDAQLVTVKGGTNDWGHTPEGKNTDRVTTTYRGALRILMEGLIEKYPDRQIVFFTPIKRCEGLQTPESVNKFGDTLNDYANAVLEIAADYDIPAINLYTPEELDFTSTRISAPYTDENGKWHDAVCEDERMPDGLHPSGTGHITISEYMLKEMYSLGIIEFEGYEVKVDEFYLAEQVRRIVRGDEIQLNGQNVKSKVTYESSNTSVATVDSNGKVKALSEGTATITATSGIFTSTCKIIVLAEEIAPIKLVPKSDDAPESNAIISSLGDSITTYTPNATNQNYHDWWAQWYYVTNEDMGVSQSTISDAYRGNSSNVVLPFIERYTNIRSDADLITVKGGTNDWSQWSKISFGDINSRESSSFEGAVRLLMEGLLEKYPTKSIVFFTPIKRVHTNDKMLSGGGHYLEDYAEAVIALGKAYGIPVIDLFSPEQLDFRNDVDTFMPDGLHPNANGQKIMAEYMINQMKSLGIIEIEGCEVLYGDVDGNGEVDSNDLVFISRNLANWTGYDTINEANSNLNNDTAVDSSDSVILARFLAKWSGYDTLPFVG